MTVDSVAGENSRLGGSIASKLQAIECRAEQLVLCPDQTNLSGRAQLPAPATSVSVPRDFKLAAACECLAAAGMYFCTGAVGLLASGALALAGWGIAVRGIGKALSNGPLARRLTGT